MRPVTRGDLPKDKQGHDLVFMHYREARDPLVGRIGDFCSYCEVALHSDVDVEHVRPKKPNPTLATTWSNFLLACSECNSIKGATDCNLADYVWPDSENTARAFIYEVDAPPKVNTTLPAPVQAAARATLELAGLDRHPGHPRYSDRDRRWIKRREAWGAALIALSNLQKNKSLEMRQQICMTALSRGYWSVWMQVFSADREMRQQLIEWFPGTAGLCFDGDTRPVPRPGGKL